MTTTNLDPMKAASLADLLERLHAYDAENPAGSDGDTLDLSDLPTFGGETPSDTSRVWSWDAKSLLLGTCISDMEIVEREDYEPLAQCKGSDGDGCDSAPCSAAEDLTEIRAVPDYQRGTARAAGTTTGVEVKRLLCAGCYDALIEHLRATPSDREWYLDVDGDRLVE
jgi:hypothetical protein